MKRLFISALITAGLTFVGLNSFAVDEMEQQTSPGTEQQMNKEMMGGFTGEVADVQGDNIKVRDEAGTIHPFTITGAQNLGELQSETLKAGDKVHVQFENQGREYSIHKMSESGSGTMEESRTEVNKPTENQPTEGDFESETRTPAEGTTEGTMESGSVEGNGEYVVKSGDTLSEIAAETLGSEARWREIAEMNNIENPDEIYVGQHLRLPSSIQEMKGTEGESKTPAEGTPEEPAQ